MDAAQVIATMNTTWATLIDKYYDHIADEYIAWMSREYNVPVDELRAKAEPVKAKILASAEQNVNAMTVKKKPKSLSSIRAAASKANTEASENGNSVYAKMSRKELIDTCKSRSLPVKRKNLDMINALVEFDKEHHTDE